jgi:hypothetical protein
MARRDRTTGLPRSARPRGATAGGARVRWTERHTRFAILGGAILLLIGVLGAIGYRIYDQQFQRPNKVILRVDDQRASLRYYADRLGPFVRENTGSGFTLQILEEELLNKLEREALTVILAREQGIGLGEDAVTAFIATQLGTTPGGPGSTFDTLYRQQLRTLGMSNDTYRKVKRAELADTKLKEQLKAAIGTSGEQLTLRVVVLRDQPAAQAVYDRIAGGEDMGTVAQTTSLHPQSRQNDGLFSPEPIELLPQAVRALLEGKGEGELFGPVQVETAWWVFRVESIADVEYTQPQIQQLADVRLTEQIRAKRAEIQAAGKYRRNLSASDIDWAEKHA